jgi:hypothetical protein
MISRRSFIIRIWEVFVSFCIMPCLERLGLLLCVTTAPAPETAQSGLPGGGWKTQESLRESLIEVRPNWLDGAIDYRLPSWFDEHRVDGQRGLPLHYLKKAIFFKASEGFKAMGAPRFVRCVKCWDEGAWWPSQVGAILPEAEHHNLAKRIIDNAHSQGLPIIIYYRHMEDRYMADEHPDWICRDSNNEVVRGNRGIQLCFNSPYAQFVLKRLLELVDMGANGFYFDSTHMPKKGCWCKYCRIKFAELTGLQHPAKPNVNDSVWNKLIDFNNLTVERTFLEWRSGIHSRNPNVVMLVGSHMWPTLSDRHLTNRLFRISDSVKTEFSLPARTRKDFVFPLDSSFKPFQRDAKIALGYTMARDAADGRPGHVWTHGLLNEASTLYATAGIVTHGCIANLDIQGNLPNPMFDKAFKLGEQVSPYLAGNVPLRWAALHYSEYARDHYVTSPKQAWEKVLYPFYGAYLALLRSHLPVGIITDSQLEEGLLDGYKVLFVLARDKLTDRMQVAVQDFRTNGGLVVEQLESWQWHDAKGGQERAICEFLGVIANAEKKAPVRVYGGPEKMHAVPYITRAGDQLTVCLANDFSWVYTGRKPSKQDLKRKPPLPCAGVTIALHGYGTPKKVFDAVSGLSLCAKSMEDRIEISVPSFEYMSVIVAEL